MKPYFIFTDIETSGLKKEVHEITQLAAVVTTPTFEIVSQFNKRTRFDVSKANPKALEIGHYDPDIWSREAVPFKDAAEEFKSFVNDFTWIPRTSKGSGRTYHIARMAGHNVKKFDGPFLFHHFQVNDVWYPFDMKKYLDTLELIDSYESFFAEEFENHKLPTLCEAFGVVNEKAHDAIYDCLANVDVAKEMVTRISNLCCGSMEKTISKDIILPPPPTLIIDTPSNPMDEIEELKL